MLTRNASTNYTAKRRDRNKVSSCNVIGWLEFMAYGVVGQILPHGVQLDSFTSLRLRALPVGPLTSRLCIRNDTFADLTVTHQ